MKKRLIGLVCGMASTAFAQLGGGYLGPAVLSSGASGVGTRSGQQVDLRFYAGVNGIYDSSIQPVAVNANGTLVTINGLYGVEANVGVYGTHDWKTAVLGLDYRGTFREYNGGSAYDGIDQFLTLGYTWQESRRVVFKAQALAGTLSDGLAIGVLPTITNNEVATPTSLLFDNRSYYLQGGMDVTLIQSARTLYTFGAQGFDVWRQSSYLVGVEGYNARGTVEHRLNKNTSVGFNYQRQHYDFPKVFGQANIDTGEIFVGTNLGRYWKLTVRGGIFHAEVSGLESVALSPVIAALLGQTTAIQAFYRVNYYPSGQATLTRRFKRASLGFSYGQGASPGNGIYLTSRSDNGAASYSYTGIRRVSLAISGGYSSLNSIGQGIAPYRMGFGGAGITYTLPYQLHLTGRYDYHYQEIESLTYKHTGNRVTVGLTFSPGQVPLSLW
ncbi:MAG: hypothetical protein ABSF12_09060 [Bryobacteraceae bacterium]